MTVPLASEHPILKSRASGEVDADVSFEQLYELYKRPVYAWLALRVKPSDADDLAQDVWTIFYRRWQGWRFPPELVPEAKPVLSFLYRTCHLTLVGFRRLGARERTDDLDLAGDIAAPADPWHREFEVQQCLTAAQAACTADELEILIGKLTGVSARTIARTLSITESAVDHGYRRAIAKVRAALLSPGPGPRQSDSETSP
jgi:DNA-directed RNA polymerase specialized sigma24 family protein